MLCFFYIHTNFFTVFECAESCCASFSQRHQFASLQELPNRSPHALKMMPTVTDETEENNNTFVIFKIKSQHLFQLLLLFSATVHSDITLEFQAFLSHSVTTYTAEQGKRKNCDYDFKRKNNVCLSAYMILVVVDLAKNFYLIHTRNEMSANSEEKEEENPKFKHISLSSFVTSFYSSVYVHLFVHLFACRKAATTYCLFLLLQARNANIENVVNEEEGYMAWPLNVPSYLYNPFPFHYPSPNCAQHLFK